MINNICFTFKNFLATSNFTPKIKEFRQHLFQTPRPISIYKTEYYRLMEKQA